MILGEINVDYLAQFHLILVAKIYGRSVIYEN